MAEVYARLNDVETIRNEGIFGYAINVLFKNGTVGVLNLNASQCPDWQISEAVWKSAQTKKPVLVEEIKC